MKSRWKRWSIAGVLAIFLIVAAGCGGKDDSEASDETGSGVYPVSIDGIEILVGETTVQPLLDKGYRVTVSNEIHEYEIDPELKLEPNSYHSDGKIWITDHIVMHISMVTPKDQAVRMGDAIIAFIEFSVSGEDQEELDKIKFNGVPVTELTREKAGDLFPDFTGDENMWFSPVSLKEYEYFTAYDSDGKLTKFSVEKQYDED